jgi:hypothetical protein
MTSGSTHDIPIKYVVCRLHSSVSEFSDVKGTHTALWLTVREAPGTHAAVSLTVHEASGTHKSVSLTVREAPGTHTAVSQTVREAPGTHLNGLHIWPDIGNYAQLLNSWRKSNQQMHCNCVSFLKIYLCIAPTCFCYSLAVIRVFVMWHSGRTMCIFSKVTIIYTSVLQLQFAMY